MIVKLLDAPDNVILLPATLTVEELTLPIVISPVPALATRDLAVKVVPARLVIVPVVALTVTLPLAIKELYLYFTNISTKPFCKINADKKITYLHKITKPINELDCLIVQFKDTNTEEETNFHNFNGKYFSLELNMNCDKN